MDSKIFFDIICFVVFAAQLALCFAIKRRWIRLLPAMLAASLVIVCVIFYCWSGFTNWAWLIILALIGVILLMIAVAWVIFGLFHLAKKVSRF